MRTAALEQTLDWTQVLVVGVPILVVQLTGVLIAVLNHRKASDAASTAKAANAKVEASAEKIDEVHRQTMPSNGTTFAHTLEEVSRKVDAVDSKVDAVGDAVTEVRQEQGRFAVELGRHFGEHDQAKRREPPPYSGGVT